MKMNISPVLHSSLIDADDSILIVIDVQDYFVAKLPQDAQQPLIKRIAWLIGVATHLKIPLVVTGEDIPNCGTVSSQIAQILSPDVPIYNKMVFGLADDAQIMAAVRKTGRKTAILIGLETDVCVTHSAIGLLQQGYQVAVVEDATASPETGHQFGLQRLRGAGILISSIKSLYYEWVRTVARDDALKEKMAGELGYPSGIAL